MREINLFMNDQWFIDQKSRICLGFSGETGNKIVITCGFSLDTNIYYYLDIDSDTLYVEPDYRSNTLTCLLDGACLGRAGAKALQLRASNKDKCLKSNVVFAFLESAINGECRYPNGLPTEFAMYENKIRNMIEAQEERIIEAAEAKAEEIVSSELPGMVEAKIPEVVRPLVEEVTAQKINEMVPDMITAAIASLDRYATDPKGTLKPTKNPYLFEIEYTNRFDYASADEFLKTIHFDPLGGCSGFKAGAFHVRNFDFTYNDDAMFVLHHKANGNQLESIGMAGARDALTRTKILSGQYDEDAENWFTYLPYVLLDGINSKGICVQTNMLCPFDQPITKHTNPTSEVKVCALTVPRYILDNLAVLNQTSLETLLNGIDIWCPNKEGDLERDEYHWMVSDVNSCFLVELMPDPDASEETTKKVVITDISDRPIMTNFYTTNAVIGADGKLDRSTVNPHGVGLERYEIINAGLKKYRSFTSEIAKSIAASAKYSLTYTGYIPNKKGWCSEMCGEYYMGGSLVYDITVDTPITDPDLNTCYGIAVEYYNTRGERPESTGDSWETVHTAVYDLRNLSMSVWMQENYSRVADSAEITFKLV